MAQLKQRVLELEDETENSTFWSNQQEAKQKSRELSELKETVASFENLEKEVDDATELAKLSEHDEQATLQLEKQIQGLEEKIKREESKLFLSGKYDRGNAVLAVSSGAGGQDAQDWAAMLLRMYQRFAEQKGWKVNIIHESFGEQGPEGRMGIKQASIDIDGSFAYGLLKRETGVHRLVRLSPFSAKSLRHTSFAAVEVLPEIRKEEEHIEIKPEDIKIEVSRSSGPGGQNVNKRETAVRIVHIKTGVAVESQTQRSQQQNKERALEILAAKLYALQEQKKQQELAALKGKTMAIEWGSQIRSYVLHPYQMVKDHRTNSETSDTQGVLNGNLQQFIEAELSL